MVPGKGASFNCRSVPSILDSRAVDLGATVRITMCMWLATPTVVDVRVLSSLVEVVQVESLDMGNKRLPLSLEIN